MKKRIGAVERLFPMPVPLVVGGTIEDADVLAVAWINIVSSTPPTIALGLRESRHTLELIRRTDTFTVNLPTAEMAAIVDYCGLVSGAKHDKFAATGLTLSPADVVPTPIIDQCPYNIECRVSGESVVGSYRVLLGEIVESHVDTDVLRDPDGDIVDIDALDPLIYCAGVREYRRIGDKVADAFSVGRSISDGAEENVPSSGS